MISKCHEMRVMKLCGKKMIPNLKISNVFPFGPTHGYPYSVYQHDGHGQLGHCFHFLTPFHILELYICAPHHIAM